MSSAADALYLTVRNAPGGYESLAPRLGMSAQILRNKVNPNCDTNQPYLSDVENIMTMTGDVSVLHALAKEQSCVVIPIDATHSSSDSAVLEVMARAWMTNGDVGAAVNHSLEDGRVEMHEVKRVKDAIHRSITALHELQARLEGMAEK